MSSQPAAAPEENEPTMEEILASIRKIIADDSLGTKRDAAQPKKPKVAEDAAGVPEPEDVPFVAEPVVPAEPEPIDVMIAHEVPGEDADVLDLASVATVASMGQDVRVPEPAFEPEDVMMPEPTPVMVTPPPPKPAPVMAPPPVTSVATLEDRIISDNTSSLVGQAFAQLSLTKHTPMPAVGRSLEDVVVELLRPMLRGWIDEHLPAVVEKLVKAEIERVARGG